MSEIMLSECYPVTGILTFNNKPLYQQNFGAKQTLTKTAEGVVSCPLFKNGKCDGIMPCIIKAVYPEIKMVGPE